jgi:pyruvate,orthophosphate dikinase
MRQKEGIDVHPEVMIPLISHVNELKVQQSALEAEARAVMKSRASRSTTSSGR